MSWRLSCAAWARKAATPRPRVDLGGLAGALERLDEVLEALARAVLEDVGEDFHA
jgi:hypothetical protein